MKTYWVLRYYTYYPAADNFLESFRTRQEAEEYILSRQESDEYGFDHYKIIDISDRL